MDVSELLTLRNRVNGAAGLAKRLGVARIDLTLNDQPTRVQLLSLAVHEEDGALILSLDFRTCP